MSSCGYCTREFETALWQDERCRVILASEPGFDAWCRVVWNEHMREFSDLVERDRSHMMAVVATVEKALILEFSPVKMNLAALGTTAPHLHFHVIPRFTGDPTFPDPVWTARRHAQSQYAASDVAARLRLILAGALRN